MDKNIVLNIDLATFDDLPMLSDLFNEFDAQELLKYGFVFEKDIALRVLAKTIKEKSLFVFLRDGKIIGAMVGTIASSKLSKDIVYQSIFLYVRKQYRPLTIKFIRLVEKALNRTKVTRFIIGNFDNEDYQKLDRFYQMIGFKKLESHYVRSV